MLNDIIAETNIMYAAQSRLFIDVNIYHEVHMYGSNYYPETMSLVRTDGVLLRDAHYSREDRFRAWQARKHDTRVQAAIRLRNRLAYEDRSARPYNPNDLGHMYRSTIARRRPFAPLAEAVRDTIKAARVGDRAGQREGKHRLIELAYNCDYTSLVHEVMGNHWPVLRAAVCNAQYRFDTGHWKAPVWAGGGWIDRHPAHFVHASRETPGNVAFYADTDKLEADKLTSMKPGRYLSAFYGDVLTEEQIKQWANKQQARTAPVELKLVGNDDPLGWVWVYENSIPSCMRYNRSSRYIDSGLKDGMHPVTVYAHPENNLALAYTMLPDKTEDRTLGCPADEYVVGARVIVNTQNKAYLRIYGACDVQYVAMKEALERAGYTQSSSTLYKEKLRLVEADSGYLCPYLDGNYIHVSVHSSHLLVGHIGTCAHETRGYVVAGEDEDEDEDRRYCAHCDSYYDEEEGSYVESVDEWVCDGCTASDFVWTLGRNQRNRLYPSDSGGIVYCEYNGQYYETDYLSSNGMGTTEDGEVYPDDQLVGTQDGVYRVNAAVELTYAFNDYGWALRDSVYRLPNGETCHVDDADKIAEIEALEQEAA